MTGPGAHECAPYEIPRRVAIHGDLVNHRTVLMATWSITALRSWRPGQLLHRFNGDLVNHRTASILMRFPLRNADARL